MRQMTPMKLLLIGLVVIIAIAVAWDSVLGWAINPSRRVRKLNESSQELTKVLHSNDIKETELQHHIDSLSWELNQSKATIDSLEKAIEQSKQKASYEYKGIRYWNDARRDSFWRVESTR